MVFRKFSLGEMFEGLAERAVDAVLLEIYFGLEFPPLSRKGRGKIEGKVLEDLESFNYQSFKRAYSYLKQKGFIQTIKEADCLPKITKAGQKRINSLIPFYDEKRVWDGKIYLVTYDLPVEKNKERDYLRNFLKKIGCGMLQQSIWITPYNPSNFLKQFIKEHDLLEELILVSSVGKGGAIAGMTFTELIEKVYHLSGINEKYKEFIFEAQNCRNKIIKNRLICQFLSILKDDLQLPFSLLPNDWMGDKAHRLFREMTTS